MSVQAAVAFLNGDNTPPNDRHRSPGGLNKPMKTTTKTIPPIVQNTMSTTTNKRSQGTNNVIGKHAEELTALYQEALDNYESAKVTITKLEADVEVYACDSTKVRDYEIRVKYLAQKLEQVSEERDLLEQELAALKEQHTTTPAAQPTQDDNEHVETGNVVKIMQEQQVDDAYYDEILDAYEEHRSQENDNNIDLQQKQHNEQRVMMEQMLAEYDQGMKMAMETYVADLEKKRLENKTLQSMVKKQDELIKKLENQCSNTSRPSTPQPTPTADQQYPLHQQQQQSKQQSDRTKKFNNEHRSQPKQQPKLQSSPYRSSIDVLEEIAKADRIPSSIPATIRSTPSPQPHPYHHQRDTGRSTPPPFAPPRTPLPPLPTSHSSSSLNNESMTRTSLISYSRSSTSSTSWSSDEHPHHPSHHPLSTIVTAIPKHNSTDDGNTNYAPLIRPLDSSPPPLTSGSFWKGLKKKF